MPRIVFYSEKYISARFVFCLFLMVNHSVSWKSNFLFVEIEVDCNFSPRFVL